MKEQIKLIFTLLLICLTCLMIIIYCFNQIYILKFHDYYLEGYMKGKLQGIKIGQEWGEYQANKEFTNNIYKTQVFCEVPSK